MHAFEYILILLGAVLVSNFLSARFPRVSTPLIQIATGVALTFLPLSFEVDLEPELFMVLFIAPLLFEDAKKMDKPALWRLKYPILLLALGLVFLTVLILGFCLNLLAPSIPLAAAFALAAALAPTDAVSVGALKQNANISDEQGRLLQGESLLNDASSIVSFHFAVAAVITGAFSITEAGLSFFIMFVGGLVLGVLLMLARYASLRWLRARGIDNVSFHVLFEVVTPFLVYLVAEFVGVSGIIAVVAAGIAHSFAPRVVTPNAARLNVVSSSVWSVISFTLNGLVFLILGTQLPYVIERVWSGTAADTNILLFYIFAILAVILALRFVWILFMHRTVNLGGGGVELAFDEFAPAPFAEFVKGDAEESGLTPSIFAPGQGTAQSAAHGTTQAAVQGEESVEQLISTRRQAVEQLRQDRKEARKEAKIAERAAAKGDPHYWRLHLHDALLLSLTGVKGAITLAVMLSVPLTLDGTEPFPERDLLIFLASGVILLSLLVANIVAPLIAPKKKEALHHETELNAIVAIYHSVINSLTGTAASDADDAAAGGVAAGSATAGGATAEVIKQYYNRITTLQTEGSVENPFEQKVRVYVIELERQRTLELIDEGKVSNLTALIYLNGLSNQLARVQHHNAVRWEAKVFWEQFVHQWRKARATRTAQKAAKNMQSREVTRYELWVLQRENLRHVVQVLGAHKDSPEMPARAVALVRLELQQRVLRLENRSSGRLGSRGSNRPGGMKHYEEQRLAVEARALDLEREAINEAQEAGRISAETAKTLLDNVAIMELDIESQLE